MAFQSNRFYVRLLAFLAAFLKKNSTLIIVIDSPEFQTFYTQAAQDYRPTVILSYLNESIRLLKNYGYIDKNSSAVSSIIIIDTKKEKLLKYAAQLIDQHPFESFIQLKSSA